MRKDDSHDLDPTRAPSVFDIDALRIGHVYAAALLKAAAQQGAVDELQQSFDALIGNPMRRIDEASDPAALLASGALPKAKKTEVIETLFRGKTDDLFVNFLQVLNAHNRLDVLRPVAAAYRELRDELHRRVRVVVRSAVSLDDGQRDQVKTLVRAHFQGEPVLVEQIDPELIGGLQLQVGDRLIDVSVRSRLQTLKQQLLARSSHEIQRRRDRVGPQ